jgi:hypothetical protein
VLQEPDGSRVLRLNEGIVNHSVWRADTVLTGGEWDMFLTAPPLLDHPPKTMLVIGNAGGTTARAFGRLYPDVQIDGVEIDPEVTEVGRRYFGLDDNLHLHVITADGRPYLASTDKRYDIIAIDAYHQPYIPFYLATEEFFRLVRDHLTPDGIVALNVATVPGDERLSDAVGTTLLADFPSVWRWRALRFNQLLLAFQRPMTEAKLSQRVAGISPAAAALVPGFRQRLSAMARVGDPLTDDRAPVEWLTDKMILGYAADGGKLERDQLPTAPGS